MSLSCKLQEAHYCALGQQSQSNVYGLAKVAMPCGQHKLLVASLRGKVSSMEFQKTRPRSKEVHFTYIPGDAEIISIDAFNKLHSSSGVVVGITFLKTRDKPGQFLNIYSEVEPGSEINLDTIAQGCQNLDCDFIPYQLYHTDLSHNGAVENVFLLSGSDHKVHLYREDKYQHRFSEEQTEEFFPEFTDLPSPVTWLDCKSYDDSQRRLTAFGCHTGLLSVFIVCTKTKEVLSSWSIQLDSPITCLQLFSLHTHVTCPTWVNQVIETEDDTSEDVSDFHLAVASALEPAVVFRRIVEKGLSEPMVLPESDHYDSILSLHVADIDFDGQNEVLLGTYGQELLVYKYHPRMMSQSTFYVEHPGLVAEHPDQSQPEVTTSTETNHPINMPPRPSVQSSPFSSYPNSPDLFHNVDQGNKERPTEGEYTLLWKRSFPDPILGLDSVDITGDGLNEIIIMSLKGLHVLQHDLDAVSALCIDRLQQARYQPDEDVFLQLQSENLTGSLG